MSRPIGAGNITEVDGDHIHEVYLALLDFDTPRYVHSGIGTINFGGNDYLGLGGMVFLDAGEESEQLIPGSFRIGMSALETPWVTEALTAGRYGDTITIYKGFRQDDGTLVDTPWINRRGYFEFANVELSEADNVVVITVQNELAFLAKESGRKWTDEQTRQDYAADTGLSFVADVIDKVLIWGGHLVGGRGSTQNRGRRDPDV